MRIDYSKPLGDIQKEANVSAKNEDVLYQQQFTESQKLLQFDDRIDCVLCGCHLEGDVFMHRKIPFIACAVCGQVQTKAQPPKDYPAVSFASVYPISDFEAYQNRKRRIYQPKLDWVIDCLKPLGFSLEMLKESTWLEMGTGAGYFISCLSDMGIEHITAFERDQELVNIANQFIPDHKIKQYDGLLSDCFDIFSADIYVAFFVLEHITDANLFYARLKKMPEKTIFVFSVPVFGFSCLIEGVFDHNYARNLDCVMHTQLYTDKAIAYAMEMAGFDIIAQWVFGQDASDFRRFLLHNLSDNYPESLLDQITGDWNRLLDPLQQCFDKLKLSDQRHIIAIKN